MQREYQLAIVIDGDGHALIAELDETTGAIKKTHKATDLLGESSEAAGKKSEKGAKGLKTFGDRAKSLKSSVGSAITLLGKMGGVISGALGVGLTFGIHKSIEFGDQVSKLSTRIGASTEALSEYKHVAELTGVEFNALVLGWQRQTRRVAEAAKGTGEAVTALKELGLEARDFAKLAPEDQFEIIADRISKVTSESERVRLAMKLWDTDGVSLLQTIEGGSKALRDMRQEARDLGLSLSEDQVQQMVEAKNATTRLQGAVQGLTSQMAINLAPTLANITNDITSKVLPAFTKWLRQMGAVDLAIEAMSRKRAQTTLGALGSDISELTKEQKEYQATIDRLKDANPFTRFFGGAHAAQVELDIVNSKLAKLREEEAAVRARLAELDTQAKGTAGGLGDVGDNAGVASSAMAQLLAQFAGETPGVQQFIGSLEQQASTLGLSEEAALRYSAAQLKLQLNDQKLAPVIDQLVQKYLANKKAADAAAKAEQDLNQSRALQTTLLEQLKQRYDPVTAAAEQWTKVEQQLLPLQDDENTNQKDLARLLELVALARADATRAAEDQQDPNRQLIRDLEAENEALALAIANNEDLEIAKARLNGATEEEITTLKRLHAENARLSAQYQKLTDDASLFEQAVIQGVHRLDDTFGEMWRNVFHKTKNSLSAIKDVILNTFAEIAHSLTTRPIIVAIETAFNTPRTAGASVNPSQIPGVPGPGGGFSWSNLTSLFTGNGFGQALQNLPTWAGGIDNGYMDVSGGFFSKAADYSNWQYGLTALVANLIGQKIFGGYGGLGASLGATIGLASPLGPLGAVIGGLGGGLLGSFFGKGTPSLRGGGATGASRWSRKLGLNDSALGDFYLRGNNGAGDARDQAIDAIKQFDDAIAAFLSHNQIDAITEALKNWQIDLKGSALTIENVLGSRFSAILDTFDADVQHFVGSAGSLEDRAARLAQAVAIEKLIADNQALFGERTFANVLDAAKAIQTADETITDALSRLAQNLQIVTTTVQALNGIATLDPIEAYRQQQDLASRTLLQSLDPLSAALNTAIDGFDGTTASLVQVTQAAGNLRNAQVALAGQYDQLEAQINGFGSSITDQIQHQLLGDKGFYNLLNDRFQATSANLQTLTDPQEISKALTDLENIANTMIGLLSPEQIQAQGGDILATLAAIRGDAEARRQLGLSNLQTGAAATTDQLSAFVANLGDPLEIAAGHQLDAADALSGAADDLGDAAGRLHPPDFGLIPPGSGGGGGYFAILRPFSEAISTAVAAGITQGANESAKVSQTVTNEIASSLSKLPAHLVQAVYQGVAQIQVQVVHQSSGALSNA